MEGGRRSGGEPGIIVKSKSSSGCLIVRKKSVVDGVGSPSSGSRKHLEPKKENKRSRIFTSDSGSGDEPIMQARRKVGPETIRVCNGLIMGGSEIGRKRNTEEYVSGSDRKRNKVEFDKREDVEMRSRAAFDNTRFDIGRRKLYGSLPLGSEPKFEAGSSREKEKRTKMYFNRNSHFETGSYMDRSSFDLNMDRARMPISLLREKFGDSDKPIRVQGKNGVLKVMVNKRKNIGGGFSNDFCNSGAEESGRHSRIDNTFKRNVLLNPTFNPDPPGPSKAKKKKMNSQKPLPPTNSKGSDFESEDSDTPLKPRPKKVEALTLKKNDKISDNDSDSEALLKLGPKNVGAKKKVSGGGDKTSTEPPVSNKITEGKLKRGSGTEKQRLREKIRAMLQAAGWTIDYRPRRNRDYLDAVYISPAGTAFWSIIKAYEAFQKQLSDEDSRNAPFDPLSDEILSQLTRKTQKKMEREMKMKKSSAEGKSVAKQSSGIKKSSKSFKSRVNENGSIGINSKIIQSPGHHHLYAGDEGPSSAPKSMEGIKSRQLGRCTLLVRTTNDIPNSETGKRTVLSWLIDSGTVQSSQKVQYMNRRRRHVMLEGWVTRDGIHCGCCSKILTVWKFEIHAGSKLRQPFQNICLDTGVSLLQCQIDAWNRQEESECIAFYPVDTDGDDPNDDTCGICGDGGDLICCDGCPSTFHQGCLDIQMLPTGDWNCSNCTCKFCGVATADFVEGNDSIDCAAFNCTMCEKKYHKSCVVDVVDLDCSIPFCGWKCRELFEDLDRYLGVKHELESGFSWSLIRRTDAHTDKLEITRRVENNSKLAVALTIMDECFLPIIDWRSGINVIKNVFYSSRSNFHRLNFSGFYTAVLERGDEIISAASIRFHGTQIAEMPFIGTRHIYRRQGMCRRLFSAIEMALCSVKVEKLVIPANSELTHTWTSVFGFAPLESASKQEMRSLNMLVFPGIDMLHKLLVENGSIEASKIVGEGTKVTELNFEEPKGETKSGANSSGEHDMNESDDNSLCVENEICVGTKVTEVNFEEPKEETKSGANSSGEHNTKESDDDSLCVENEICAGAKVTELNFEEPKGETKSGANSSAEQPEHDTKESDDDNLCIENETNGEATPPAISQNVIMSSNDNLTSDCTEASGDEHVPATVGNDDSQSRNSLAEPASIIKSLPVLDPDTVENDDSQSRNSSAEPECLPVSDKGRDELEKEDLGFPGGKSKSRYGREGHLGITLIRFASDQSGLRETIRLAEYFDKENCGRTDWARLQPLTFGDEDEKNPKLVKVDEKTGENKRVLYGYLGTASDQDKLDFDTRKKVLTESQREYKAST